MQTAAAIIENKKGEYLLCRQINSPGLWEFPGGRVRAGEDSMHCVIRECLEKLGVFVKVEHTLGEYQLEQSKTVTFFTASLAGGEIALDGYAEVQWAPRQKLLEYEFCPEAFPALVQLVQKGGAKE